MPTTKKEAIKELSKSRVSHQEALVKRIEGNNSIKQVKRLIPGGKTLTDQVSKESFPNAINQWLKHCRHFSEVEISFLDPKPQNMEETKIYDFNPKSQNYEWEIRGKKWLAEKLSEALLKDEIVSVKVKKEGIFTSSTKIKFDQTSDDWMPFIQFTPFKSHPY